MKTDAEPHTLEAATTRKNPVHENGIVLSKGIEKVKLKTFCTTLCAIAVVCLLTWSGARTTASVNPGPGDHIPQLPDLTISSVQPVVNRLTGQTINDRVWIQITNQGVGYAGGYEMLVQWGNGYSYQQEFFVMQGLAAGQSVWVQANASGYNLWTGRFMAYVDNLHQVTESNEENNFYYYNSP